MADPILTNFVRKDRPQPSDPDYVPMSAAYATSVGGRRSAPPGRKITDAAVILKPSRGEHGTVFVQGRDGAAIPTVTMSAENYNMIRRMIEKKIAVKLRVNVQAKF